MHITCSIEVTFKLLPVLGYLGLLTRQVMCEEFSQCYDDVNICLWTDGLRLRRSEAQSACRQRDYFLPRIANSNIQDKLAEFRAAAPRNLLGSSIFWNDVTMSGLGRFHWLDGSFSG